MNINVQCSLGCRDNFESFNFYYLAMFPCNMFYKICDAAEYQ